LTKACGKAIVFYREKMCQEVALAPYTPFRIVLSLLRSVLRVPNSKNNGAKKACTHQEKAPVKVDFMYVSPNSC